MVETVFRNRAAVQRARVAAPRFGIGLRLLLLIRFTINCSRQLFHGNATE
jgi:hypothetical protein